MGSGNNQTDSLKTAKQSIRSVGYDVATVKKQFPVTGMSCASCASSVESMLNSQQGVVKATVNYAASSVQVEFAPAVIQPQDMRITVQGIGYDMVIDETDQAKEKLENIRQEHFDQLRKRTILAIALSVPLIVIGMFFMGIPYVNFILWALSTPVILWLGRQFFINAWKQATHRSANMDTLVA